jgi:acyl-CoA thioester hydrolase
MTEPHRLSVRVYYEDTDFSGVVYHANYLRYLERGRTELLRARGITQADFRDAATGQPFAFVVRRMAIEFLRPAALRAQLTGGSGAL